MEVKRQNEAKQDYIAPAQSFALAPDGCSLELLHQNTGEVQTFGTTDLFHRQVGSALNIPAKYYDIMRLQKPDLLATNVNALLSSLRTS